MAFHLCRYIRTNGLQCRGPQLAGRPFCYFHNRIAQTHAAYRAPASEAAIDIGPTEDRESVQIAISTVVSALAADRIDVRRATALLYGLQLASMNAARLDLTPSSTDIVRQTDPESPTLALPGAVSLEDEVESTLEEHGKSRRNPKEPTPVPALTGK